ncbi:MAG: hypothetical protein EHM58_06370 [Ignavibacteriae bacterium]|nr:MAG: hypothetical protein EHM58_06370 [Ignavibacteriota bacterium]
MIYYEEIKIVGVDKSKIEKDEDFPGAFFSPFKSAYKFAFKLSQYPDSHWIDLLNQYATINIDFGMKRKPYVYNDCLMVMVDAAEDLQILANYLKKVIKEVNALFKSSSERMAIREEKKNLFPRHDEILERLKDKSDNIKF